MRWLRWVLCSVLALPLVASTTACRRRHRTVTVRPTGLAGKAQRLVAALARSKWADARATFAPVMLDALNEEALATAWREMLGRAGEFQRVLGVREEPPKDGFRTMVVSTRHAKLPMDVRVVYDADEKVSGLWFSPAKLDWSPPAYAKRDAFEEIELTVGTMPPLPATLSMPRSSSAPVRAVVLVHGSGPHDRDETIGPNKPFKDLAWGLASRGVAVLRYDKRTKVAPQTLKGAFDQDDEVTFDARAAVALLSGRAGIDPKHVAVLGHSQGGSMAPRIARGEPKVAAIAILAGDTRPFDRLLLDQHRYLLGVSGVDDATAGAKLEAIRDELRRARSEGEDTESLSIAGVMAPRRYYRDLLSHRGADIAKELSIPIFVAQGARDYQVTMEDFGGWKAALSPRPEPSTFRVYGSANHLFMRGEGPSTPDEYRWPGHVELAVIEDLARWIHALP